MFIISDDEGDEPHCNRVGNRYTLTGLLDWSAQAIMRVNLGVMTEEDIGDA